MFKRSDNSPRLDHFCKSLKPVKFPIEDLPLWLSLQKVKPECLASRVGQGRDDEGRGLGASNVRRRKRRQRRIDRTNVDADENAT